MLKPKRITLTARYGSPRESPIEIMLELQPDQHGRDYIHIGFRFRLQLRQREEELPASDAFYDFRFAEFVEELAKLTEEPVGKTELPDADYMDYLSFRKIAGRPDVVVMNAVLRSVCLNTDYYADEEEKELKNFMGPSIVGVAFQGILLTNEETARLAQELKEFLASGE